MASIFRKTDKGHLEIETRAHRLTPRLRAALILVDGKRNSDELRAMIPAQADETLAVLLEQGFVEKLADAPPPRPAAPMATAVRRTGSTLQEEMSIAEFAVLKRHLLREFNDLTGPTGEVLALRLEKAIDRNALSTLLPAAGEYIASVRGAAKATEFRQRFAEHLEAA